MKIAALLLILTFIAFYNGLAQDKFEKEYRIGEEDIPALAKQFILQLKDDLKVKWYGEESQDGKSVEAKVKIDSRLYSIEFDSLGYLQDVEIIIKKNEIPTLVIKKIDEELESLFVNYQFNKIQKQYLGKAQEVLKFIKNEQREVPLEKNYEIVVKGKNDEGVHLYEITFNEKGELVNKSRIIFKSSDHLEY